MGWSEQIDRWGRHLGAAGRSTETIGLRLYHLRRAARELNLPVDQVTLSVLEAWLDRPGWSSSTKRSYRASLRLFFAWCVRSEILESSPAAELPPIAVPRSLPRPVDDEPYAAALAAGDDRQRRALRLAAECGLRRGEVARVHTRDVEPDLVGWALRVKGKGGHVRLVPLPDDLARELRGLHQGFVFPSPRGGHLTPAHLGKLVSMLLPDGIATHSCRHRAGTNAYAGTLDLRAVQEFLGHAKPETTALYTKVGRQAIRQAQRAAAA